MKVKQISDTTIKITIKLEDLEDRGMELADFLVPQEKTEEFFYSILDELEMPDNFKESGMLSFRVTPKPDKLDIFVTKSEIDKELDFEELADFSNLEDVENMSPDDFLKILESNLLKKTKKDEAAIKKLADIEDQLDKEEEKSDYIYFSLVFDKLEDAIVYASTVDFEVDTSELYKMDDKYYMTVLINLIDKKEHYDRMIHARILEFAEDTYVTRPTLQEHGVALLHESAINYLQKVRLT